MIKGFIDTNQNALNDYNNYPPILGNENDYEILENDIFITAIANIENRKNCVKIIEQKGGKFTTLIHRSVVISDNATIGEGCVISRDCIISNDVKIGNHVIFNSRVMVGHDTIIEDFCTLNAGSFLGGFSEIGTGVSLHTYSIITPRIKVNDYAIVGAGSVVVRNVDSHTTVFGNPAKIIFNTKHTNE